MSKKDTDVGLKVGCDRMWGLLSNSEILLKDERSGCYLGWELESTVICIYTPEGAFWKEISINDYDSRELGLTRMMGYYAVRNAIQGIIEDGDLKENI